jgi:conjugal transfer/entry exclusion protein
MHTYECESQQSGIAKKCDKISEQFKTNKHVQNKKKKNKIAIATTISSKIQAKNKNKNEKLKKRKNCIPVVRS